MRNPDQTVFRRHTLDAISQVHEYLRGVDDGSFHESRNRILQDAVFHQLQIIGEAAGRLSPELRGRYSKVPWHDIIGMRNRLVHDYFRINLGIVWTTTRDAPALRAVVERMLFDLQKA
jgi:uncharacterized protein with HEPN domain